MSKQPTASKDLSLALDIRPINVAEYHCMAEAGVFHPEERVELITGQLVKMAAKGTAHTVTLRKINRLFTRLSLQLEVMVQVQDPIVLDNYSEPEPDLALLRVDPREYIDAHPTAADTYLAIEVADSSFKYDCETKGKLYAQSNIAEYWVVDVIQRQLHVFRQPSNDGYQSEVILTEDASISPLQFPQITIYVQEMFAVIRNQP
ncbi:MAG: Uma2 family endonuclease [Symploca sp. SIO2E6]|nr:Uma2 family endonuclease [Symploca sp. SIO2E6]